ncbi:anthrone oxygenase family protein [Streptomyces sp. NPDC051133]|uniref:anthrone oxygenase family protein n=1 Tax=Streptomyces sp. NPDC051133 TaxID=3155521 RepID=UPI00341534AA
MKTLQLTTLLAATVTTGLMAGLFAAFGYAVMPGLHRGADRTFVEAMQNINRAILNPLFLCCFMGALGLIALATWWAWRGQGRQALPWLLAALVLYTLMFVITAGVNVPLNDRLAAAGGPGHLADPASARQAFEATWVRWNTIRAVACVAAFGALTVALVVSARTTAQDPPRQPASAAAWPPPTGEAAGEPSGAWGRRPA